MATAAKLMTAEEFWLLPETEMHRSLVRGEVEETTPPGARHGSIASAFNRRLGAWAEQREAGWVGVESGFVLARNPDIVRAPDISFVRAERIPADGIPEAFWNFAPDIAIEVIDPTDTEYALRDTVRDFLAAGTPLVWIAYPRAREVVAYTPDDLARIYRADDTLTAPDVLPGFSCPVAAFFA